MDDEEKQIRINVNLHERDYNIIREFAREKGLGGKGFSAALRQIVRDWEEITSRKTRRSNSGRDVTED